MYFHSDSRVSAGINQSNTPRRVRYLKKKKKKLKTAPATFQPRGWIFKVCVLPLCKKCAAKCNSGVQQCKPHGGGNGGGVTGASVYEAREGNKPLSCRGSFTPACYITVDDNSVRGLAHCLLLCCCSLKPSTGFPSAGPHIRRPRTPKEMIPNHEH